MTQTTNQIVANVNQIFGRHVEIENMSSFMRQTASKQVQAGAIKCSNYIKRGRFESEEEKKIQVQKWK